MTRSIFQILGFTLIFSMNLLSQDALTTTGDAQVLFFNQNSKVEGSQYLFKDWRKATLIDLDGNETEDVNVNYDGIKEKFISKVSEEEGIVLNIYKYKEVKVVVDGEEELYVNLSSRGQPSYAKLIYGGEDLECFLMFKAKKRKSNKNAYNDVTSAYKIRGKKETYIYKDGELTVLRRNKKSLSKLFPNHDVKSLIKKNKLDLDKDKDLKKLFEMLE